MPDSPKPLQRIHSYFPDPGTKHDAHCNGVCSVHNLSRLKSQPQPAYAVILWKVASCDILVVSRIDFRHFHAVTSVWPSISRYARQAAAQSNHQCQRELGFHAIVQEKKGGPAVHRQKSKIPYSNQECGPTFRVICEAQILCFAVLRYYIPTGATGSHMTRCQVEANFFSAEVTKTGS